MQLKLFWTNFKNTINNKKLAEFVQYLEIESEVTGTEYTIFCSEQIVTYYCVINDSDNPSDVSDFENNYKSYCNKRNFGEDSILATLKGDDLYQTAKKTNIGTSGYTNIINVTVSSGKRWLVSHLSISPNTNGEWYLDINGNAKEGGYIAAFNFIKSDFCVPLLATEGQTVRLRYKPQSANAICYGCISGMKVD